MNKIVILIFIQLLCCTTFSQSSELSEKQKAEVLEIYENSTRIEDPFANVTTKASMRVHAAVKDYEYLENESVFDDPWSLEIANANAQPMSHKYIRIIMKVDNTILIVIGVVILLSFLINFLGLSNLLIVPEQNDTIN